MLSYKYLIVGGGLAGSRAAEAIRGADVRGRTAIIAAESHLPYLRPPLSKGYLVSGGPVSALYVKQQSFYAENAIDLLTGFPCVALDRTAHAAYLSNGREIGYEKLLLATGISPWRPPFPGNDLGGVFTLSTIGDADAIRGAAAAGTRALILGGGYIACEVAGSLMKRGVLVTMAFPEADLFRRVAPPALSLHLHQMYTERGARILPGNVASRFLGDGDVRQAELSGGEALAVDFVVLGTGSRPSTGLARQAGLAVGVEGGITVDDYLCSSDPNIFAAGDIAAYPDVLTGKRLRVEHWDVSRQQGAHAGANMAGQLTPYTVMPHAFGQMLEFSFETWGDLSAWEETVIRGSLERRSFACFYFHDGVIVAALGSGLTAPERRLLPEVVRARHTLAEAGGRLANADVPLDRLVATRVRD